MGTIIRTAHPRHVVADMLGRSLGTAKALEAVDLAAEQLRVGQELNRDDALRLLEHIARQPGIVGIAARFAKARVHLIWGEE